MMFYDIDRKYTETFQADWEELIEVLGKEHQELYAKVAADEDVKEFDTAEEKFFLSRTVGNTWWKLATFTFLSKQSTCLR